jgi:hypothetical protein
LVFVFGHQLKFDIWYLYLGFRKFRSLIIITRIAQPSQQQQSLALRSLAPFLSLPSSHIHFHAGDFSHFQPKSTLGENLYPGKTYI